MPWFALFYDFIFKQYMLFDNFCALFRSLNCCGRLTQHNSCPVCRFRLPTLDAFYESVKRGDLHEEMSERNADDDSDGDEEYKPSNTQSYMSMFM